MADLPAFILDSFALLAYLQDEPAAPRIETLLENAKKEKCLLMISIINLGEILYITERKRRRIQGTERSGTDFNNCLLKSCLLTRRQFS